MPGSGKEFVYCDLAKWNEQKKETSQACRSLETLETLFATLYQKYFLNYNLKLKTLRENAIKEKIFRDLPLDEQK